MRRSRRSTGLFHSAARLALLSAFASVASAQTTQRASVATDGTQANHHSFDAQVSSNGRFVAFDTWASSLVPGDTNGASDVFVHDRSSGVTERVSVSSTGAEGDGGSAYPSASSDGRWIAFVSNATNFAGADANGNISDVFVRDRVAGTTELVSVASSGAQGPQPSENPALSADGRFVAYESGAVFVPNDTNGVKDVYVRDRLSGTTERVSVSSQQAQANNLSTFASISGDGRFIAFQSSATNLVAGDTNGEWDIFVRDRALGTTQRVNVSSQGAQASPGGSWYASISADGHFVAFFSAANNLAPGGTSFSFDVFVRDRLAMQTELVSVATHGGQANNQSSWPSISADGRFVAFESDATNLVVDDSGFRDVFVRDRLTGETARASVSASGEQANLPSERAAISADGRVVAFLSYATNLVPGDTNVTQDVYVRDLGPSPIVAGCFGDDSGVAQCPCGNSGASNRGCDNSAATGGARLDATGTPSLATDNLALTASGVLPSPPAVLLQGSESVLGLPFGDGLRCSGGALLRLYVVTTTAGTVVFPPPSEPAVSARSAELGAAIPLGATRHYQVYYRDPDLGFCPPPSGNSWNASSSLSAVWGP